VGFKTGIFRLGYDFLVVGVERGNAVREDVHFLQSKRGGSGIALNSFQLSVENSSPNVLGSLGCSHEPSAATGNPLFWNARVPPERSNE
jgi:hypothetical protein